MEAKQPSRHAVAKTVMRERRAERIVRAVRVEIVKPLGNETWDTIGPLLRALRSISHRLSNAAILDAIEFTNRARRGEPITSGREAVVPFTQGIPNPQTAAYRSISVELADIRDWYTRELDRREAGGERRSSRRKPKTGSKPIGDQERAVRQELDRMRILANLELPGGTAAAIASYAHAAFKKWEADRSGRIPSQKYGAPVPIRNQESGLRLDEQGRPVLTLKLRTSGRVDFAIKAGQGAAWQVLRSIAEERDGYERGDVKIVYDPAASTDGGRKGKWHALIAYSMPRPQRPEHLDPGNVLILHRGLRNLLTAADLNGLWKVIATGEKLTAFKRRLNSRRRQIKQIRQAERGTGATGHGRKRFYSLPDRLESAERDWIKTSCQQIAAAVAKLALERGAGRVAIEDYGGMPPDDERAVRRFVDHPPYHQLRDAMKNRLEKMGIVLETYPAEFISQKCPSCGALDAGAHNVRTGVYHCSSCDYMRGVDEVATMHALRRINNGSAGEWEKKLRRSKELAEEMRKR